MSRPGCATAPRAFAIPDHPDPTMLDASLKAQLTAYLQRISSPVEITAVLDDSQASRDMSALLQDIADASPLVRLNEMRGEPGGPFRVPSFALNAPGGTN